MYEQFFHAVSARIAALGLSVEGVHEQWADSELNLTYPCIVCSIADGRETDESRLNATNDIGYPVRVSILDRRDPTDQSKTSDYLLWRQKIVRAFHGEQLVGPHENVICRVEFESVANPELPKFQYLAAELTIRGVCREVRGFGA